MNDVFGKITYKKAPVVQCFPLFSLLRAIGVDTIDYFSLDVEGPELEILKTIPWNKVRINVLTIEYRVLTTKIIIDERKTKIKLKALRNYFKSLKIYKEIGILGKLDIVFARKDIIPSNFF